MARENNHVNIVLRDVVEGMCCIFSGFFFFFKEHYIFSVSQESYFSISLSFNYLLQFNYFSSISTLGYTICFECIPSVLYIYIYIIIPLVVRLWHLCLYLHKYIYKFITTSTHFEHLRARSLEEREDVQSPNYGKLLPILAWLTQHYFLD